MSTAPKGPWFVRDMRAVELRRLGWTGPSIDQILITDQDGQGIIESQGQNCIIARIKFENRLDELDDGNLADAHLMAAAPDLYNVVVAIMNDPRGRGIDPAHRRQASAALAKARGES